jgi:hypothetical protein
VLNANLYTSRQKAALELIITYILITSTIQFFLKGSLWYVKLITIPLTLAFIVFSQIKSGISSFEQGFKPKHWRNPLAHILLPSLIAGLLIITIGLILKTASNKYPPLFLSYIALVGYPIWGIIQEYIVIVFMLKRLKIVLNNKRVSFYIAAFIFATTHLPNPFLVAVTFLMSMVWIKMFEKYKNLYILGFCHGFMGACAKFFLPHALTYNFKIGNLISWQALFYGLNI